MTEMVCTPITSQLVSSMGENAKFIADKLYDCKALLHLVSPFKGHWRRVLYSQGRKTTLVGSEISSHEYSILV